MRAAEAQRLAALAEQANKQPPKPSAPKPAETRPDAKFDPAANEKLVTSKEKAQQAPSTGREINRTASLGTATGSAQRMSPSDLGAFQDVINSQFQQCYSVMTSALTIPANKFPHVRVEFRQDGSLASDPVLLRQPIDAEARTYAEAALRAIRRCAPFRIPPRFAATYEDWRNTTMIVDLNAMLGR